MCAGLESFTPRNYEDYLFYHETKYPDDGKMYIPEVGLFWIIESFGADVLELPNKTVELLFLAKKVKTAAHNVHAEKESKKAEQKMRGMKK